MAEIIVLRTVHILCATFWFGSGLFSTFFLVPALARVEAAAGPVMGALQGRGLFRALPIAALLTILSGIRLMWIMSGGFAAAYFQTARGATFGLAGLAALLAFFLSILVGRPANVRMAELRQTGAGDEAEMRRLARRAGWAARGALVALILSAVGMSVARYLG